MQNISESSEEENIGENDIAEVIDGRIKSKFVSQKRRYILYRRHLLSEKIKLIR